MRFLLAITIAFFKSVRLRVVSYLVLSIVNCLGNVLRPFTDKSIHYFALTHDILITVVATILVFDEFNTLSTPALIGQVAISSICLAQITIAFIIFLQIVSKRCREKLKNRKRKIAAKPPLSQDVSQTTMNPL